MKRALKVTTKFMPAAVRVLVSGSLLLLSANGMAQEPPRFKPVATAKQLMDAMIIPASDALFRVGAEAPTNDKEWISVQNSALILAESGNLLLMQEPTKNIESWEKFSLAMMDAGTIALKAAEARNVDALIDAGDAILASCEGCHKSSARAD